MCIDSWCLVALLGWAGGTILKFEDTACREWAAGYLPKLSKRLWRQEAEVNLCRLTLCVSPLKLISYCLPFAGSISFYVIYTFNLTSYVRIFSSAILHIEITIVCFYFWLLPHPPLEYCWVQCWIQSKYTNRGDNHQFNVLICISLPRVPEEQSHHAAIQFSRVLPGPSPGWKHLLALPHLRQYFDTINYAKWLLTLR